MNYKDFKIIQINKILNIGMLVSFINIKFGTFVEKIIQKLTRGSFGFVLIIELEKHNFYSYFNNLIISFKTM